ncbi:MAG: hypothetical protein IPM27_10895 [Nitrosomonadales bacterium]|nr:hypothetical protein [Nitrosomonadales bacterium]
MTKPAHHLPVHRLALRVRELGQLFNSMDPTPFLNKDLDPQAEDYIETWAAGYAPGSRFDITIHLEQWPTDGDPAAILTGAIHNHFSYQAERKRRALKQLFQQGRKSLVIGLAFVTSCLLAADAIGSVGDHAGYNIARESLTIIGWVAMWRPMEIFLYAWWPIRRQISLYEKLAEARIHVTQGK